MKMRNRDFDPLRMDVNGGGRGGMMRARRVIGGTASCVVMVISLVLVSNAFALPEGRHYEMVSPVYKGGYGVVDIEAVAADGESGAFYSSGGIAWWTAGQLVNVMIWAGRK
jgi:hypothetical protein